MKKIKYNKLVRDRIPEIVQASGKTCGTAREAQLAYCLRRAFVV